MGVSRVSSSRRCRVFTLGGIDGNGLHGDGRGRAVRDEWKDVSILIERGPTFC